ncbi:MAG TPA: cyclic nucleotide-binding domain-containing protein [Longimicrobiales bacterium]|nr:cyclic nucleotide-binding domain-containing protein [Longimicrobiales bacterium]
MSEQQLRGGPLLHLSTARSFQRLAPAHLLAVAGEAEEVSLPRGSPVLVPHEPTRAMHVVVDGIISVARRGERWSVGAGEDVGFLEVLAREAAGAEATAESDTVALRLDGDALREVQERHFGVLSGLVAEVAARVARNRAALLEAVRGMPGAAPLGPGLGRVERMLALHRSPAFPSAGMDALAELADHMRETHLVDEEPLWMAHDPASFFYLVCSGTVRYGGPGRSESTAIGPGGVPGLPVTLSGGSRAFDAVAAGPVIALLVEQDAFLDVLEDHFEMASAFLARLAGIVLGAGGGAPGALP